VSTEGACVVTALAFIEVASPDSDEKSQLRILTGDNESSKTSSVGVLQQAASCD
jgi:hypothetical protein